MNERDRNAADDWMRGHLPDPDDTQKYFFLRHGDSATVVYELAVLDGKLIAAFTVVLKSDPAVRQTGASVTQPHLPEPLPGAPQHAGCSSRELLFAASKK